tara:strand:+ start:71 stop:973 length:903 start_codon:yes stop_codon:yes gene_type:complete
MSWLFSQALVAASSEDISLDGAPCALWNGTPTQLPSWCSDRTMAACRLSRSGTPFKPLTDDPGEAVLMSFLEASPVPTSPLPEKAQESTENSQACGHTWQELLVQYDLNTSLWKTHHCLWEEDLPESSVTLPRWGMMQDGECWERITLPPLIGETVSGLWPTPTAAEADKISNQANYGHKGLSNHPAIVGEPTRPKKNKSRKGKKNWPTPVARDHKGPQPTVRKNGQPRSTHLPNAVGEEPSIGLLNPTWVESYLMGWPIAWTSLEPLSEKVFQEWEKTFPIGWTDLNALETDKSRSVQR